MLRDIFFNIFATFSLSSSFSLCLSMQLFTELLIRKIAEFRSGAFCMFETLLVTEQMSKKQEWFLRQRFLKI